MEETLFVMPSNAETLFVKQVDAETLFVKQANSYARGRPTYPPELFQRLASLTTHHERAWDVGTGNGQSASMIAEHYRSVVATDVSAAQISFAERKPNVTYAQMSATPPDEELERVVGAEGSVDLVTAAAALHWFDLDAFYPIVRRVLRKPGGVFAAWTYYRHRVTPEVDAVLDEWLEVLRPFRAAQAEYVRHEYRTIPFPFEPVEGGGRQNVEPEVMELKMPMTYDDMLFLWRSSSAAQTALEEGVELLTEARRQKLLTAWGSRDEIRTATFRTFLLMGTVSPPAS